MESKILIIIACVLLSGLEAFMNAMYDNSKKTLSGWINVLFILAVLIFWVWLPVKWTVFIIYPLIRYAIFDIVYNLLRIPSLGIFYLGTTKWTDQLLTKFLKYFGQSHGTHGGKMFLLFSKIATFIIAVTI